MVKGEGKEVQQLEIGNWLGKRGIGNVKEGNERRKRKRGMRVLGVREGKRGGESKKLFF